MMESKSEKLSVAIKHSKNIWNWNIYNTRKNNLYSYQVLQFRTNFQAYQLTPRKESCEVAEVATL